MCVLGVVGCWLGRLAELLEFGVLDFLGFLGFDLLSFATSWCWFTFLGFWICWVLIVGCCVDLGVWVISGDL